MIVLVAALLLLNDAPLCLAATVQAVFMAQYHPPLAITGIYVRYIVLATRNVIGML